MYWRMSLRRWQLIALALGLAVAGFLPTLAFSSPSAPKGSTTISLVRGTQTTTLSAKELERTVYHLSGSKLRSTTIVITVNGKTRAAGPATKYKAFIIRAHLALATNRLRAVLPDVESYYADNVGTRNDPDRNASTQGYAGMTMTILRDRYFLTLPINAVDIVRATRKSYCLEAAVQREVVFKNGPAALFLLGRCPAAHP
jgi:hypothetical protein